MTQLGTVRASGRVLARDGQRVLVASARATEWLEFPLECGLCPGDLVEWVCHQDGSVELVLRIPAPEPRGDGDVARFLLKAKGAALRARHAALQTTRRFFDGLGFVEVETPAVVPCPGLDAHVHSLGAVGASSIEGYLRTSPELHMKRLLVGGLERIYQIAHCYRSEERGTWHEPEFTMLEWYEAFGSFETLLDRTEDFVRELCVSLNHRGVLTRADDHPASISVAERFERLSVSAAFREFAQESDVLDLAAADPDRYYRILTERVEPGLARLSRPVFLFHYPATEAALARRVPGNPNFAERTELYALGIELSNGFVELTDPSEQRTRFDAERERRIAAQEPLYPIDERFLASLEEGMPPSVGNALGFDRLLALCLGSPGIAPVMAFPVSEK